MSPRPAASRHDVTARRFLGAAAALIDAAMTNSYDVPPRLRSIKFPAALDWIRVEDVIRVAGGGPGGSKKAFHQRWATRDEFISDAVVYALQFRDRPDNEYGPLTARMASLDLQDFGGAITELAQDLLTFAESQPRSYLMLHIGGVLHRHPELQDAFRDTWGSLRGPFLTGYITLLNRLGLTLRPGWTAERFDRALQAVVDGFLLQGRIHPDRAGDPWTHTELFAETVLAFTVGVLDAGATQMSTRHVVNAAALSTEPVDQPASPVD